MIYLFRGMLIFSILTLINLVVIDGGAGMEVVWLGIIVSCLILSIEKLHRFFFSKKWFKGILISCLVLFTIVESFILFHGFKTNSSTKSDYIIILGARVRGEIPSLTLKYRLDKAYEYLDKNQEVVAILSGGQGSDEAISESEAMRRYLVKKGIGNERLIMENQSTSTYENLTYSFAIIDNYNKNAAVIIVTSRFHVLRSKMVAKDLGKKVEGLGARTMLFLIPNYYLREFFAVAKELVR